ncbi:hypothetical protein, partial [Helicobacter equorum]
MKILFINTNQIVQKLVEVTAQKANVELQTVSNPSQVGDIDQYDYIIVDDGCYNMDKTAYDALINGRRACLIYSKHEEMSKGFSEYIKKPFIPTHILEIMVAQIAKVQTKEAFSPNSDSLANPSTSQEDLSTNADDNSLQSSPLEHLKALSEEYHLTDEESNVTISDDTEQTSTPTEIGKDDILGDLNLDDIDLGEGLEDISLDETHSKSPTQEVESIENTIDENTQIQSADTEVEATDSQALDIESTDSQPESKDNDTDSAQSQDEDVHDENLALDTQDIDLGDVDLENADLGDIDLMDVETQNKELDTIQELSELANQKNIQDLEKEHNIEETQVLDSEQISEVSNLLDEIQNTEPKAPDTSDTKDVELEENKGLDDILGDLNLDDIDLGEGLEDISLDE